MINRRNFIKTSVIGGASTLIGSNIDIMANSLSLGGKNNKKNVIWLFSDQHRAQAMAHQGDPNAHTPNLDKLAKEGITFQNAFSGCPWSTPFRGTLLTGKYPNHAVYRTPMHLDKNIPLITDTLKENGYLTAHFGKWHLYGHNSREFVPRDERGRYDVWIGYENNNAQYDSWVHGHDIWGRDDKVTDTEKLAKYETDALIDKAIEFLVKRPKNKPFFLVIAVQPPHNPHIAPPETMAKYNEDSIELRINVPPVERIEKQSRKDLAGYYAQIENLDYNIGRLLDAMKRLKLLDNTHFAYFSDHGDCHGSHGYTRKSSPWQEAVRIPCIFRPAGITVKEHVANAMFNSVDFAPTTLGLCGIDTPEWMEGTDFSNYILGTPAKPNEPQAVLLQHIYPKDFSCLDRPWRGIVTNDGWKYIVVKDQPIMLFNLNEDPYELNNMVYLANKNVKTKRAELAKQLQALLDKVGDKFIVSQ